MARLRSRQAETEDVNQRRLQRGAVKRQHLTRWAVGVDELAPGVVGITQINPSTLEIIREGASSARLLVMSATAASVDDGGDYVTFDTVVAVQGFEDGVTAGASWVHPIEGVYVLDYEHAWDTYEDGGTVEVEVDGTVPAEGVIGDAVEGSEGRGTISYYALGGSVGKIKVTHAAGIAQDCDAVMRLAITDPINNTPITWTKVFEGDAYDLAFDGTNWWTTASGTATVTKRDADFAAITTFSAALVLARGITFDGTDLWIAGDDAPANEKIVEHDLTGAAVSEFDTGPDSDGNTGVAWDGTHLWLVMSSTGVAKAERWTTAGVLDVDFDLPGTPGDCQGVAYFENCLYVVDMAASAVLVFQTDGTLLASIDVSGAVSNPTGIWIAPDGTLYIAKDGDGIYRRTAHLAAI